MYTPLAILCASKRTVYSPEVFSSSTSNATSLSSRSKTFKETRAVEGSAIDQEGADSFVAILRCSVTVRRLVQETVTALLDIVAVILFRPLFQRLCNCFLNQRLHNFVPRECGMNAINCKFLIHAFSFIDHFSVVVNVGDVIFFA